MDSDDISLPNRFKTQLEIFKNNPNLDICGSWVGEFENDENEIYAYRKLPQNHDEIYKFAKTRSPLNHPSVMFKKSAVLKAKNYQKSLMTENYFLWVRMILGGARFYNIPQMLVKMRAGKSQLIRHSGLKYAINEFKVQREFYKLGFLNFYEFILNASLKFIIRLLPKSIISRIYSFLRNI
nr:hypothetical protein [Campylobacter sp.]